MVQSRVLYSILCNNLSGKENLFEKSISNKSIFKIFKIYLKKNRYMNMYNWITAGYLKLTKRH